MVQQRDEQLGKTNRRGMAQLLEAGKIDSATIRVENIIRSDIISELHELLELYCELLSARAGLLEGNVCDPGLEEAVKSIIYAAPKTEIKELSVVRNLLAEKYGKEFTLAAMENSDGKVSEKVIRKLSVEPPKPELVQGYLEEIAKAYGVNWPRRAVGQPPEFVDEENGADLGADGADDDSPSGGQVQKELEKPLASAQNTTGTDGGEPKEPKTPLKGLGGPRSPLTVTPPRMTTDNVHPKVTLGSVELKPSKRMEDARRKTEPEGSVPDISDLERRFAALKKQ
jgi:vacuolar protein sorting-associated protein IST1